MELFTIAGIAGAAAVASMLKSTAALLKKFSKRLINRPVKIEIKTSDGRVLNINSDDPEVAHKLLAFFDAMSTETSNKFSETEAEGE